MRIAAKFKCESVKQEVVKLTAATGPGNEGWSQYTPSGDMTIAVTNPAAQGTFEPGEFYLLTFEPFPKGVA